MIVALSARQPHAEENTHVGTCQVLRHYANGLLKDTHERIRIRVRNRRRRARPGHHRRRCQLVSTPRGAVGLGHNLGLRVVAEGLQDRMAEAVLVEAGCDAAQGFLVGRPAEETEITALLMQQAGLTKERLTESG